MRRRNHCLNCGELRELAAHGLCFTCYRREDRARDREFASIDLHNPGIRREHQKLFRGFSGVMIGLSSLGVSKDDALEIRRIIAPYLGPIEKFLAPAPEREVSEVNSERENEECSLFTEEPTHQTFGDPRLPGSGVRVKNPVEFEEGRANR
jgi:hypothetical protein